MVVNVYLRLQQSKTEAVARELSHWKDLLALEGSAQDPSRLRGAADAVLRECLQDYETAAECWEEFRGIVGEMTAQELRVSGQLLQRLFEDTQGIQECGQWAVKQAAQSGLPIEGGDVLERNIATCARWVEALDQILYRAEPREAPVGPLPLRASFAASFERYRNSGPWVAATGIAGACLCLATGLASPVIGLLVGCIAAWLVLSTAYALNS